MHRQVEKLRRRFKQGLMLRVNDRIAAFPLLAPQQLHPRNGNALFNQTGHAVSTRLFRLVQGFIRTFVPGRKILAPHAFADPKTCRNPAHPRMIDGFERQAHFLRRPLRPAGIRLRHQDNKFFSSHAKKPVIAPDRLPHHLRGFNQHFIADGMAPRVIDALEMIKVKQHHRQRLFISFRMPDQRRQRLLQRLAIANPGQAIPLGQLLIFLFQALRLLQTRIQERHPLAQQADFVMPLRLRLKFKQRPA